MDRSPAPPDPDDASPIGARRGPLRGGVSMALTVLFGLGVFSVIRSFSAWAVDLKPDEGSPRVAGYRWRTGPVLSLEWSPDGSELASTHWESELGIYRMATGRHRRFRFEVPGSRSVVGWSPEDRGPTVWGLDGSILAKPVEGDRAGNAEKPRGENDLMALARVGRGRSIRLWGPTDRREQALPGPARPANCLAISPDGRSIASGGGDGSIRCIDLATRREVWTARLDPRPSNYGGVSMVGFAPDGRSLAACGVGPVRILDAADGLECRRIGSTSAGYSVTAFSPDGRRLAAASWKGDLEIWDAASGLEMRRYAPPATPTRMIVLAWSPDGRSLASGGFDGEVSIWEADAPPSARTQVASSAAR